MSKTKVLHESRRGEKAMWRKLKNSHPWLYEAKEWLVLAVSVGACLLALSVYLGRA